ncbi:MarR family transcriptional regulator [Peribacillus butanolivorans]|uniref:MarR family winged helix-turn-helix transcriptional regulator n=1 Tax=Peribacillus butanolivorans TaxID=421767 RepID=UPI002E1DAF49|nr:MarR family transcriptional regulator [Peribacillus butanolivorans]
MGEENQAAHVVEIERELRYVSSWLKQRGREILSDYKITIPQFLALQWLFEAGDMTIGELSTKMFLAFSTTTELIDRMEKHQLVQRVKDEKDRRVVRIQLLEEGERIIEEVINKRQQYLSGVLVNFSESDIVSLSGTLAKLHQEMKEK